ncbi:hypothetical protein [Candidatus Electrothrix sp.]|uniref:hypothetical protein n=1 Tax=Candidatus Electrothrix sp. TaxID=2170559 RepID=UPI0040572247
MLIGTKKEFREDGAVFYEHSDERLYPNYLTWCGENGRENQSKGRGGAAIPGLNELNKLK